ncbi:MAG TPA: putative glycoside hydrolase [Spirochaetota bacterium]|nr:putative glycoside hydrolase [Spirochaetota bacterium]HPI89162.1 putative glycoside hydrolase [Spirochaetota bacterium]HPR46843.1 putative glycoside hydrolase [Spirochaetota bacterium]
MKRFFHTALILLIITIMYSTFSHITVSGEEEVKSTAPQNTAYQYPEFYRGIYLNVYSARNFDKLKFFINKAKEAGINTLVMDVQSSKYQKCIVPAEHVQYCKDQGIHAIARIVVFPEGLKHYPVSREIINEKMDIAESACINGFREIQFDYIRFNDSKKLKYLSQEDRYRFIEGLLLKMRNHLKKYNALIAADIFGRIPLNRNDLIGQRMEGLDKVVDIICPMAYPSHYTWSKKLQNDPYYTVLITSKNARERTKEARIVTYIQAFQMKLGTIPYRKYIREQIRAIHDAGVKGFIFWNARQEYDVPLEVTAGYYSKEVILSEKEKGDAPSL